MTIGTYLVNGVMKAVVDPPRSRTLREFQDWLDNLGDGAVAIKFVEGNSYPAEYERAIVFLSSAIALSSGDEGSVRILINYLLEVMLFVGREYGRTERQQPVPGGPNANL